MVNLLVARRRLYLRCHRYIDRLSGRFGQSVCRVKRTIRYSVAGCGSSGVGERGTRSGSARRRLTVSRSCELAVGRQHFDGAGLGGVVAQGDRGELGGADVGEPA